MEQTLRDSFCFRNKKRHLEEEQQVQHILLCQHKQSRKATFPPRQLWLRGGAGRCQRFSQNNVTRRGIPVRPRKRGGRGGSPNRAGQLTSLKPALAPSRGSFSRSPPPLLCLCRQGEECDVACQLLVAQQLAHRAMT